MCVTVTEFLSACMHELGTGFRTHPGFATTTSLHRQILDHVFLAATMVSVVGKFWQRPREEGGGGRW